MAITQDAYPERSREKPKEDSFFDYESQLPQDRFNQAQQQDNTVQTTQQEAPVQRKSKWDIYNDILSYRPPKPNYDPNRPEEMKRLARSSAIGKGLNLVGDMVSLGAGGNVNRRQNDDRELGFLEGIHRYNDDFNRRLDQWNYRDFTDRMRKGELALNLREGEERARAEQQQREQEAAAEAIRLANERKWEEQQAEKEFERKKQLAEFEGDIEGGLVDRRTQGTIKEINARKQAAIEELKQKAEIESSTGGASSDEPDYIIYDNSGKPVPLSEGEREKILTLILTDEQLEGGDVTGDDLDLLKPRLGQPMSTNSINTLVQKYWQRSPSVQNYLKNRENQNTQTQGSNTEQETTDVKQKWGSYAR